jgi:hypothetical protein
MRALSLIAALAISFTAFADTIEIRKDAPDRHVVVKGDTLWDISAKFLQSPWKWPELWRLNKEEIRNPHLIYPGDVILLTWEDGKPRLSKLETVRLSPEVHYAPLVKDEAITTLPYKAVAPFMSGISLMNPEDMKSRPRILGSQDERVLFAQGDTLYASFSDGKTASWDILRPGKELRDPDSNEVLGHEAEFIGRANTLVHGSPATLQVAASVTEIMVKDRLVPSSQNAILNFVPHAPEKVVEGKIISAYGGGKLSGSYTTVVINRGRRDGLDEGSVLAVYRTGRLIEDTKKDYQSFGDEVIDFLTPFDFFQQVHPDGRVAWRYVDKKCVKPGHEANITPFQPYDPPKELEECPAEGKAVLYMDVGCLKPGKRIIFNEVYNPKEVMELHCRKEPPIKLPDNRMGLVMVYRVFDKVSYALVVKADGPIHLLDATRNP